MRALPNNQHEEVQTRPRKVNSIRLSPLSFANDDGETAVWPDHTRHTGIGLQVLLLTVVDVLVKNLKRLQSTTLVYGSCNKLQGTYEWDYANFEMAGSL